MPAEIYMPKMSDHMETGTVIRWLVEEGTPVEERQPILEIETDKAIGEVESPASGILRGIRAGSGTVVAVGEVIAFIAKPGEQVPVLPPFPKRDGVPVASQKEAEAVPGAPALSAARAEAAPVLAAPAARRVAKELGVDLDKVHGTGPGGRIKEEDVRAFAAQQQGRPAPPKRDGVPTAPPDGAQVLASPMARKVAEERGIDLGKVIGTGPGGRITNDDVLAYAQAAAPKEAPSVAPKVAPSVAPKAATPATAVKDAEGEVEWVELSTIRRITGERMTHSKKTVPHFALTIEVDMAEASRLREKWNEPRRSGPPFALGGDPWSLLLGKGDPTGAYLGGAAPNPAEAGREVSPSLGRGSTGDKLSHTALLVKVVALALKRNPLANAEFVDGRIKVYRKINVGVAVGTEQGLVVPVIHAADTKSLAGLNQELKVMQEKSKSLRYSPEELAGGTFTLSNLGMFGIDQFSAIINAPQSAILAVGRIVNKPVGMPDATICLRPMMSLTLSVDHRVLDGATGARFLADVKALLENPYQML